MNPRLETDPLEYTIPAVVAQPIRRSVSNPKGGVFRARVYSRLLKNLTRVDSMELLLLGERLPKPGAALNKKERALRLGYTPSPRGRGLSLRCRKRLLMDVYREKQKTFFQEVGQ